MLVARPSGIASV